MPHKHNPISFENMCGLSRVIRGYAFSSYDNIPLYHERDISHSSSERIIFPDALILTSYILRRMTKTINNLVIHEKNIRKNIYLTHGVVFSQRVLTRLIEIGLNREIAYDNVQRISNLCFELNIDFKELLISDQFISKYLNKEEIEKIFDESFYLRNVDYIYKRCGLE